MHATPCRLCGYDAPGADCPHCSHRSSSPSIQDGSSNAMGGILDGLRAVPVGLLLLLRTRGVKRFLIPPVILTTIAFLVCFWWAMDLVNLLVQAVEVEDMAQLGLEDGWFKVCVVWLLEKGVASAIARISGVLLWLAISSVVALYTFSVVYEAVAGPFLDEIQGRLEAKWFGKNPRDEIERPTDLPSRHCAGYSAIGGVAAILLWLVPLPEWTGIWWWLALLRIPFPFVLMAAIKREYAIWLGWVIRVEGHLLWVSIKSALAVLCVLLLFFPLKFVPLVGLPMFMAIAGFGTAITLLDIPFSRRRWSLAQRLRFARLQFLPLIAFGAVASFVFMVPVIGPIVLVPAASIGGLWLVVRLDKDALRPEDLRRARDATSRG